MVRIHFPPAARRAANRLLATKQRHPLPVGGASSGKTVVRIRRLVVHRQQLAPSEGVKFAGDSPLEGNGFELPVP